MEEQELIRDMLRLPTLAADNDLMDTVFVALGLATMKRVPVPEPTANRVEGISYSLWLHPVSAGHPSEITVIIEADQFNMKWEIPDCISVAHKDTETEAWEAATTLASEETSPLRVYDPFKICPDVAFWERKGAKVITELPSNHMDQSATPVKVPVTKPEDPTVSGGPDKIEHQSTPSIDVEKETPTSTVENTGPNDNIDADQCSETPSTMMTAPILVEKVKRGKTSHLITFWIALTGWWDSY